MPLYVGFQLNPVADEVSALVAVVRPILQGVLYALRRDIVDELGGYESIKLKMLSPIYRPGDGDCGICFQYAVNGALDITVPRGRRDRPCAHAIDQSPPWNTPSEKRPPRRTRRALDSATV